MISGGLADLLRFRGPFAFIYHTTFGLVSCEHRKTYAESSFFCQRQKKEEVGADTRGTCRFLIAVFQFYFVFNTHSEAVSPMEDVKRCESL